MPAEVLVDLDFDEDSAKGMHRIAFALAAWGDGCASFDDGAMDAACE
jgi:hypothetical protein